MTLGARSSLWGWGVPSRALLAILALLFAAGLHSLRSPAGVRPAIDPTLVVDPNTAPRQVLLALPRLGPVLVGRIVAERERAPFRSLEDFDARVRGVGPATAAALRPFLRFGPDPIANDPRPVPDPVAPNTSRHAHD